MKNSRSPLDIGAEEAGIPTISMGNAADRMAYIKPPRTLRACAKITSHFRIPSSGHLCLRLNRKILEIVLLFLWICSIGAAKSDLNLGANSVKLFLHKPLAPYFSLLNGRMDQTASFNPLFE